MTHIDYEKNGTPISVSADITGAAAATTMITVPDNKVLYIDEIEIYASVGATVLTLTDVFDLLTSGVTTTKTLLKNQAPTTVSTTFKDIQGLTALGALKAYLTVTGTVNIRGRLV
jgi:hypothetical protein